MNNKLPHLIKEDTEYINLIQTINKRFKSQVDSNCGFLVINKLDDKILFVNNSLLNFLNKQWIDLIFESVSSILSIEDYTKLTNSKVKDTSLLTKFINPKASSLSDTFSLELVSKDTRTVFNVSYLTISIDNTTYDILYGISCNPLLTNIKCDNPTLIDPWINSFTKLMYTVTDDYNRFWMFILGIVVSIFISQVTLFINKPAFICANKEEATKQLESILKLKLPQITKPDTK